MTEQRSNKDFNKHKENKRQTGAERRLAEKQSKDGAKRKMSNDRVKSSGSSQQVDARGQAGAKAGAKTGTQASAKAGAKAGTQAGPRAGTKAGAKAGTQASAQAGTKAGIQAAAQNSAKRHGEWQKNSGYNPAPSTERQRQGKGDYPQNKQHYNRKPSSFQDQRKASSAEEVAVGDRIVVTIKRIGINGEGVGYYKRKAVFIEGAITDEVVKAKVTAVERSYLQAELVEIEKKSKDRQQPPCPVYEQCGGCQLQHMTYEAQLRAKEEIVREAFSRYADLKEPPLRPIYGMEQPWHYRNKAQLQLGLQQGNKQELVAGLYAAKSHKLIDISECTVQESAINDVYKELKHILLELDIDPYDERTRSGCIKTIVVRIAKASGQMQVTFVTATDKLPQQRLLVQRIREQLPEIITIAHNIHKERSSVIFGQKTVILWGQERLPETLGSIQFALSPRAFFQLNPTQTVKLYDAVKEAAALTGNELVVDAYCGTGTISLWIAEQAKEVRGVELIAEAVTDARSNAQYSGIDNALFYEGRAEQLIPQWVEQGIRPDVIVVDPPRTGLDAALIEAVLQAKPERFVYVSCNPSTLAKDCKELLSNGYELEWVQPVDMFPQTAHVECVILMERREK